MQQFPGAEGNAANYHQAPKDEEPRRQTLGLQFDNAGLPAFWAFLGVGLSKFKCYTVVGVAASIGKLVQVYLFIAITLPRPFASAFPRRRARHPENA